MKKPSNHNTVEMTQKNDKNYIYTIMICKLHMHPTDLSYVWICYECRQCFIFKSDKDGHTRTTGHNEIRQSDITEGIDTRETNDMQHNHMVKERW